LKKYFQYSNITTKKSNISIVMLAYIRKLFHKSEIGETGREFFST